MTLIGTAMHEWKDSDEVQEIGIWVIGSIVAANIQNKSLAGPSPVRACNYSRLLQPAIIPAVFRPQPGILWNS
jgi:hypothetical protein